VMLAEARRLLGAGAVDLTTTGRRSYPTFFGKMDKPDRPSEAVVTAFLNDKSVKSR
jgi:hypothetical protein